MKTLYVVDASGYLYRSYFAIRNVTNAKGESTNALFGFIRSLQKLRKDFNPEHLVAIFDGPHSIRGRKEIYADYKAHRAVTPPDLAYQIEWARQACALMGIPYLSVPGVEADDTMGSVAVWASKHDAKVYLCTSDKDLCQFVDDKINILNTFKENQILGPQEVEETYGAPPRQMVDLLAMTGDASDNIPGLPGFGPKTAAALLKEFGSLDYLLAHPEAVTGKKRETLMQHGQLALLSRRLVTINTEVDFPKDRDFFAIKTCETQPLKEFYASMNFNSLIRELEQTSPGRTAASVDNAPAYRLVDDEETLNELVKEMLQHKEIALATISSNPQPIKAELVGVGFCMGSDTAWYAPANGALGLERVLKSLKEVLESPEINFYGHNIKNDFQVFNNYGVAIASISFDTMLASYLLNSHVRQHTLAHLSVEHFGQTAPSNLELLGKGKTALSFHQAPLDQMAKHCGQQVDCIRRLKELLEVRLHERKLWTLFTELELPLIRVLASMERHGIYLDLPYLEKMSHEIARQIKDLEREIYALAGEEFNLNSPKQVSEILFNKMGIKPPKKTATGLSTNADVLESLQRQHPIAGKILEYRTLEKLRSTYIDSLPLEVYPKTQRIHCTFNQTVAATGRLSCQDPNLQNIPIRSEIGRKIRGAFRPQKEGWSYLAADYSQIELRLLAHLSEDPALVHAFQAGEDIHAHTASLIFNIPLDQVTKEQRHNAKAVNFGVIYGQQSFGLAQELGIDVKDAALFIDMYFKQYKRVKEFVQECHEKARQTGKAVTYTGRERLIPEINSKNGQLRSVAERLAINTPLQGAAADLIKTAMLQIDQRLREEKKQGYMILQIHDELIFELPDEEISGMEKLVREMMQGVVELKVPLIVDIAVGKNWAAC